MSSQSWYSTTQVYAVIGEDLRVVLYEREEDAKRALTRRAGDIVRPLPVWREER